ncbi:hypothetical protein GCM10010912_62810 [Paenibacillus albidus]|uniref:Copper amine oxidase-like N-terminal domain-containing protein n=1 Tax=Paenibacillus albidus TaxID=2041023 RepID=A0A917D2F1_9BACL|nr:copper amine oxidase N-terminal domain-containing protein [Paenibacillus albidus]GGG09803.1 hypothetical protein GCM10010912_62810 [Paenibacillus albidus]
MIIHKRAFAAIMTLAVGTALSLPSGHLFAAALAPELPAAAAASTLPKTVRSPEHPIIREKGSVYLPLRETAAMLDLQVLWNAGKSSIEVTGLYQALSLKVGQPKAYTASNAVIMLGAPTLIREGVTYVSDKLFSKAFNLPVTWNDKTGEIAVPYAERYLKSSSGKQLFWVHKGQGVVYSGPSGTLPSRAGAAKVHDLDWVTLSARTINSTSYVLSISNAFGEPHINESRYRLLLHKGQLVRQAHTSYRGVRNLGMNENVFAFQGNLVMVDRNILTLVNPDGHVFQTYHLADITGIDDAFAVEAVEPEFLVVRPYQKGTLMLIDRHSNKSVVLYPQLLGAEDQAWLEEFPDTDVDYPGDQLRYTGRSGNTLSFEWASFTDNRQIHFTYALPPFS